MFELTPTSPNFTFGKLWPDKTSLGLKVSDSEQCLNLLQIYLISIFVNFSCELGHIMTRYDFLEVRCRVIQLVTYLT